MIEETDTTQPPQESESPVDDKRFEVKWRKKSGASSQTAEAPERAASQVEAPHVDSLQRELEAEQQRVRELQDRWQRAAADLANLRRRTEQEKVEVEKFASMLLVQQLLPVLDNFDRALDTIPGNLHMLTWIQGVMLIERHLRAILEQQGLEAIEAAGQPFNAYSHEAISEREIDEVAPGTVLQEYQKGYTMHGRVIRPTLVEVAKAPAAPTQEESPAVEDKSEATEPAETTGDEIADEAETKNVGP